VAGADPLPKIPLATGRLQITVVYPAPQDVVGAVDSSFIFGSVGRGDARLSINGIPVAVHPNGAWLAWMPFPHDSLMTFDLVAVAGADTARLTRSIRRAVRFLPPTASVWIDSTSLWPVGRVWWPAGEPLSLTARAGPGATLRLLLPDGTAVPFTAASGVERVADGVQAFDLDPGTAPRPARSDRYVATFLPRALGRDPGALTGPDSGATPGMAPSDTTGAGPDTLAAVLEAVRGADTLRLRWPLRLAALEGASRAVELDDDPARLGDTDRTTVGRALPGGTYHWFFPQGTRTVANGRINDDIRLRLSAASQAWVAAGEVRALPAGAPAPRGVVGSVAPARTPDGVRYRIPVGEQVPWRVIEDDRRLTLVLHSVTGDVNWIRYGQTDDVVSGIRWDQPSADEVTLTFDLVDPVWGWRAAWDRGDLLFEIRRPPALDEGDPLRGVTVVVDPGHPPLGATGPTGLREADANLGVALELRQLLEEEGARVLMTRTSDSAVALWPRVAFAERAGGDVLVSVHNNALPDGVDPFRNSGTSTFYNQPRSLALAREVQRGMVRRLGVRDLGYARADLALVRTTWMPSILTEGLFMMIPEQEYALRTTEGRRRYAEGVRDGLERFLRARARRP
jgi:N-acetylmuramoyl-L-alanine amidase